MLLKRFIIPLILMCNIAIAQHENEKHLFILSGQSNMQLLRPKESFAPILNDKYGKRNVIISKYALGTQSIRRWYKNWNPPKGINAKAEPDLYNSLMVNVQKLIKNQNLKTITFIWMQGERDAKKGYGSVYENSLLGLYHQLSKDLGRTDINFIIGRLSDFGNENQKWPDWNLIREIQVKVAESNDRFGWINTDDLNSGINRKGIAVENDIHMSAEGYVIMGERFATKAIEIIQKHER